MQNNDFIRISYSGKLKENNQNLDKEHNIPVIVGANWVLPGVEDALKEMNIGDKRTIEITPERGFGNRDPKLVKLVSEKEFKRHNTTPYPGMIVDADGVRGRVLSVSSGRVKVDFNHPLAGKVLVYELEIKEKIENLEDKIKAIIEYYTRASPDKFKIKIQDKELELETPPMLNSLLKNQIAKDIMKFLDFQKVNFKETFEKPKEV